MKCNHNPDDRDLKPDNFLMGVGQTCHTVSGEWP